MPGRKKVTNPKQEEQDKQSNVTWSRKEIMENNKGKQTKKVLFLWGRVLQGVAWFGDETGQMWYEIIPGNEETTNAFKSLEHERKSWGEWNALSQAPHPEPQYRETQGADNQKAYTHPHKYVKENANNNWFEVLNQYKQNQLNHPEGKKGINDQQPYGMLSLIEKRKNITESLLKEVVEPAREHEKQERSKLLNVEKNPQKQEEIKSFINAVKPVAGDVPGSSNPTSDIDVNMRGDGTEYAVKWMNNQFKEKYGAGQESGVVYDVNFYGQDFVPPKFIGLKKSHELDKKNNEDNYFDNDEKWRNHVIKDKEILEENEKAQELSSLLMMRVNMQKEDWETYCKLAPKDKQGLLKKVDDKYEKREKRIRDKKVEQGPKEPVIKAGTGIGSVERRTDTELSSMSAENAIYEEILEQEITPARIQFQFLKRLLDNNPDNEELQKQTDKAYADLKQAKSEAMTYANAAYYTAGAVISVVTNKQQLGRMYKDKNEKENYKNLKLSPAEYYHAFTEQIGFAMHGLHKASGSEEAFYTEMPLMGKYVHRAYNNIKHLSIVTGEKPPYNQDKRNAASDWEGIKQGKMKAIDYSGYSIPISGDLAKTRLEEIIAIVIGQPKLPRKDEKLDVDLAIQQITAAIIKLKTEVDVYYNSIKKK